MISIIIAVKFPKEEGNWAVFEDLFAYWRVLKRIYGMELIIEESYDYNSVWDQPKLRNQGAKKAKGNYLLFTDIDHVLSGNFHMLEHAMKRRDHQLLRFPRFERDKVGKYRKISPHINTFIICKEDFVGYDESFCGNYGHDDTDLFRRTPILPHLFPDVSAFVVDVPDHGLTRDPSVNKAKLDKKYLKT